MRHVVIRGCAILCAALLSAARESRAQNAPVTVVGVAWDSLRNAPLEGAFVTLAGSDRSATTDAKGRFRLDSLTPGTFTFQLDHPQLDSIRLAGLSATVTVRGASDTVRLGLPSFGTIWRMRCDNRVPADSALVFGTVRSASDGSDVPYATVRVSWLDIGFQRGQGVAQTRMGGDVRADSTGTYVVCGVPAGVALRFRASADSAASGNIDPAPTTRRVIWRDLTVGRFTADGPVRATLTGTVLGANGAPLAGATVTADGAPAARSGDDGRFTIAGVPTGSRQVSANAIGMQPLDAVVDVTTRDSNVVTLSFQHVTTLNAVKVIANKVQLQRAADFDQRRTQGLGSYIDSTMIGRMPTITAALSQLPFRTIRTLRGGKLLLTLTSPRGGDCVPVVYVDGVKSLIGTDDVARMFPDQIAAVELYKRGAVPMQFDGGTCGALVVWTKGAFP